jgi:hypothetical protein
MAGEIPTSPEHPNNPEEPRNLEVSKEILKDIMNTAEMGYYSNSHSEAKRHLHEVYLALRDIVEKNKSK